ncbi:MAG: response regulator [Synechococcales bacterium]|nr:response regulator [Synechococcales bacterium]
MSDAKELEIRLQFLDEAQDYLSDIDAALLGIADNRVDPQKVNEALRAAHSVKGGASVMGFSALSDLAHRLEDALKVLKLQRDSLVINAEVEHLLLSAVDCLYSVISQNRQGKAIPPQWLRSQALPIFEQIRQHIGEPQPEDANSILMMEEDQDIVVMLFQTEVEGCLQRLESVLKTSGPCLREEVEILAQELGGLAEMAQLDAFGALCASIGVAFQTHPHRGEEIAHLAQQAWRRSQALVLAHRFNDLPTTLELSDVASDQSFEAAFEIATGVPSEIRPQVATRAIANFDLDADVDATVDARVNAGVEIDVAIDINVDSEPGPNLDTHLRLDHLFPNLPTDAGAAPPAVLETLPIEENPQRFQPTQQPSRQSFQNIEEPTVVSASATVESTVRVPTKQLNQLSDLFGELVIERNRLNLEVKALRDLIQSLTQRVQTLNQANTELRTVYDKVATQTESNLQLPSTEMRQDAQLQLSHQANAGIPNAGFPVNPHLNTFDSLEMDRYSSLHLMFQEVMETVVQIQEVTSDINLELEETNQTTRDLNKTTKQLQASLTQLRMRPLADVLDRFPKALRELSLQYNKPVKLRTYGGGTLVDRNILEALNEPLLQIIRNAFDHGIEDVQTRQARGKPQEGLIEIRAFHRSNRTVIIISDDGQGISLDKVRSRALQMGLDDSLLSVASDDELLSLIFEPGFSTADKVTSLSGRGIGMDIVRNRLKQIRGEIKVDTQVGQGTTFTISVPFTLSVARVLLTESNHLLLAFPIDVIEEMIPLQLERIVAMLGSETFDWHGEMVQLVRLSRCLKFNGTYQMESLETPPKIDAPTVLLVTHNGQRIGLQVDRCWGEQEVAIRKVEGDLPLPPGFTNCTILGDGRVVPLVNVPELLHWIASYERSEGGLDARKVNGDRPFHPQLSASQEPALPPSPERKPTLMVVDDSINVRRLLALTLEKAGYRVVQAKDGQDAFDKLTEGLDVQAIVCDIEMPRLDGYGFLAKCKALPEFEPLPIIMLTSRSGSKHRQLAMSLGASAYFSKPYNERALLQTLEKLIGLALVTSVTQ